MKLFVSYMSSWIIYVRLYSYILFYLFIFSSNVKNGRSCAAKKRRNILKKEKRKVKKAIFDEEIKHRVEYESRCMSLEKDNCFLKQSFGQFKNQSLVRRSCTNSRIYSTIKSICKDKKSAMIDNFRKALPSFKNTDVLHVKTISSGAFGTVQLVYILSVQQRVIAIRSFCDKSSKQHILAKGLVYSEMSRNVNLRFLMAWLIIDV